MISALALLGPRANKKHLQVFLDSRAQIIELLSPSASELRKVCDDHHPNVALIFGGDGTVNRHLSVLVERQIPALIVPAGSGNDLARAIGTPTFQQSHILWQKFLGGNSQVRLIDLGCIRLNNDSESRYFSCCANMGLDAEAARRTNRFPDWIKSHGGYFLGGVATLLSYHPEITRIESNEIAFHDRNWFMSISNTPTFGGGLKIAPQACIDDGKLDVTLAPTAELSRAALAYHLPKIFSAHHTRMPQLTIFRTASLRIETETPQPVYADGEYMAMTPCDIRIAPKMLRIVTS